VNTYMSGQLVRTSATFKDIDGNPADPATITLKYKDAGGSITSVTYPTTPIVKDSVGVYHADLDSSGWTGPGSALWLTEWIGTGAVQSINVDSWEVTAPLL
jgi:hypothetical protein